MENRIARYHSLEGKKSEKILKMVLEGDKKEVSCLNTRYFNYKKHKDDIVGYVHTKNKKYTGKEYATLYGIDDYKVDIYSKKKIYERVVAYIKTEDREYLAVTKNCLLIIILLGVLIGILLIGLFFIKGTVGRNGGGSDNDGATIAPSGEIIKSDGEENSFEMTVKVILPDGTVIFDGDPFEDQNCTVTVTIMVDNKEHTLIDHQETEIKDGQISEVNIDWDKLDFELTPGVYDGKVIVVLENESVIEKETRIYVVSATSGTIDISYSNEVEVDLPTSKITLSYMPGNASKASTVQVILINGEDEYILAESIPISNNEKLTSLTLDSSMKSRLQQGIYNGLLRVYMDPENSDTKAADIHTDIEVTISVYE